jgi:hypothetical protein
MTEFPRTTVGGVSLSRLICGTNWLLGYSHTSKAKDILLKELFAAPSKIAAVLEVFLRRGCNAVMGPYNELLVQAIQEAQQRTGVKLHYICTPDYLGTPDPANWPRAVEKARAGGATFCFPHQCVTDAHLDRANKQLDAQLTDNLRVVRQMGLIPGLSTHAPEAVRCADACQADVESYTQPYNAAGFLCQMEADWIQRLIHNARKPVMVIKPLGVGRLLPPVGLAFVWNTIRDRDLVTIGTMSTYEAEEDIELSLACLEKRGADVELQYTRSKKVLQTT